MAAEDRTVMKTYVPAAQKAIWEEHADALDMSQSEFLRSMVQAGRRGFDLDPPETGSGPVTPGVDGLRDRVLDGLREAGTLPVDELVEVLTRDLEDEIYAVVEALDDAGRIRYRPREGGYALVEAPRGDD